MIVKTSGNFSDVTVAAGTMPTGSCGLAAFGRIWGVASKADRTVLKYSDLLDETTWSGGSSGSVDLKSVWTYGMDEITALAEFNDFLVIFGKKSVLVYSGASDPSTMSLKDNITGVGCVARDSVQSIGTDLLFFSDSGVRTLSRTIQADGSAPIGDVSKNIRDYIRGFIGSEAMTSVRSVYHEDEGFYLINFPTVGYTFYFNLKIPNPDGTPKVTTWRDINPKAFLSGRDKVLYMGFAGVLGKYKDYLDNTSTYDLFYWSAWNNFATRENSSIGDRIKIPKKAIVAIVGGASYTITYKWAFDYTDNFVTSQAAVNVDVNAAQYNLAEYSNAEFAGGNVFSQNEVNLSGSGKLMKIGFSVTINDVNISFQKIDIYAKLGRLT